MKLYAHWTKVKAAKVSLKKPASKKGRKVTVSWKKVSGAKGYQILYADNAKMKGANSVTSILNQCQDCQQSLLLLLVKNIWNCGYVREIQLLVI